MRVGIPYDSPKARAVAQGLTAILTGEAYRTSALMARQLGPFLITKKTAMRCSA